MDRRDKTRDKSPVRYHTLNGVYYLPKDSVRMSKDDEIRGITIKTITIPDVNKLCHNPSGKIKEKIAILRSIFKQIVGVNIVRKNYKSFGYILFRDTELEMEDDRVVCIKHKGKRVAESVGKDLSLNFDRNKRFKKLLKLAAYESLTNSEMKYPRRMLKKYPNGSFGILRMHNCTLIQIRI